MRAVSTAKHGDDGVSFYLLVETVSSDRKGSKHVPTRLLVADVEHDEVHVMPDVPEEWTCPASSNECLIRQKCTNKCGKYDPKP